MATLTDLRKRLRGVQTICQLAGAMRTVSSAKLNRLSAVTGPISPTPGAAGSCWPPPGPFSPLPGGRRKRC